MGRKRFHLLLLLLVAVSLVLSGCGNIVLTKGFTGGRLYTVGSASASESELKVYYLDLTGQYESAFGTDVFDQSGNENLSDAVKDNALSLLTKVKVLNLMAESDGVSLSSEEETKAKQCAGAYYSSLPEDVITYLDTNEDKVTAMMEELALSEKETQNILSTVSSEVSDDEARTVQVQNILIKTYTTDDAGNRVEFSDEEKQAAKQKAESILQEIRDGIANLTGVTFDTYVSRYSEGDTGTITVTRQHEDTAFADACFALGEGEISDVVETNDGYRIIKCISAYDESSTEANKAEILKTRRENAFNEAYNAYADGLTTRLSESEYAKITRYEGDLSGVDSLLTDYENTFGEFTNF